MSPRFRLFVLLMPVVAVLAFAAIWLAPLLRPARGGLANRDDNGLWMRRHWLHGGERASVDELAGALQTLGIRRIYPFLGPMDADGTPSRQASRARPSTPPGPWTSRSG